MSGEDFRNRISISRGSKPRTEGEIRKALKEQYEYLTSEESDKYTQYVTLTMGQEIEESYPGVQFFLKVRDKSPSSHEGKIERVLKKDSSKDKKIYDTIGICLVIEHIPFGCKVEHALCQKHLTERAKKYTQIEEEKLKLKKIIKEYKDLEDEEAKEIEEIEKEVEMLRLVSYESEENSQEYERKKARLERSREIFNKEKEAHTSHIEEVKRLIDAYKQQYEMEDNEANNALARHILNKIMDKPRISKKLGISRIPHRSKVHDGGKSGHYIASHDSIQSSKLKGWVAEMQAMSYQNYREAKEGEAKHSKCEGKERILPPFGESDEEHKKFRELVLRETPRSWVYQSSSVNKDGTIRKGQIYVCSELENVAYHFLEALENTPELFKEITSREDLFSDNSKIVTEDDIEI